MEKLKGYDLSRQWFNFCFENPQKIKPTHTAIYFFAIEHCNRLGWKKTFGFPSQMVMEAIGVKSWHTYIKCFNEIVNWGFFDLIQRSKNQYSSNIIALIKNNKALNKALDKALTKHASKQQQSTHQSNDSIDKQITNKQLTNKQDNFDFSFVPEKIKSNWTEWLCFRKEIKEPYSNQIVVEKSFQELMRLSNQNIEKAKLIIDQSIGNGWKGFFELKSNVENPEKIDYKAKYKAL